MKHDVFFLVFSVGFSYLFLAFPMETYPVPRGELPRGETPHTELHLMSVTPVEYPPRDHQDEEKNLKEHLDPTAQDAFGNEEGAEIKYKVLSWWYVPCRPGEIFASSISNGIC